MKTATIVLCVFVAGLLAGLPTNFDARKQWNHCNFTILDQANCGSCWDFCSVGSFSDRLCITGEAPSGTVISPEPVLDCTAGSCDGGNPAQAWNFFINDGDTTCTNECSAGCAPYDSEYGKTPKCNEGKCDDGSKWPETYYGGSYQMLPKGSANDKTFQTELYNNGPLQACFEVYHNFYTFFDENPDGIYDSESGQYIGGHCVKMVGWGHEDSKDYWLFANSWGPTWADNGYFKIRRGKDLCRVEDYVSEGFTKNQAASMGLSEGVDPNYNRSLIVGGWTRQENTFDLVKEAVEVGLAGVAKKLGRELTFSSVVNVETQVVAGMNIKMEVKTVQGVTVVLKVFRDLHFQYHLTDFDVEQ